MAAPVEQQSPDEAAELEAAVRHVIEACGRAPVDPVRALIVANGMLGQELADVYAKASDGVPARAAGELEDDTSLSSLRHVVAS
ncbi:ribosomal protein L12E/L44/L45/RPP1/RPP2 [Bradyrhizobium sp. LB9.1b]